MKVHHFSTGPFQIQHNEKNSWPSFIILLGFTISKRIFLKVLWNPYPFYTSYTILRQFCKVRWSFVALKIVYWENYLLMREIRQVENMYNRLKSFHLILFLALIESLNLDNTFPIYFRTFLNINFIFVGNLNAKCLPIGHFIYPEIYLLDFVFSLRNNCKNT